MDVVAVEDLLHGMVGATAGGKIVQSQSLNQR